jgi:DNA-binding GntR family transcriptional regulator
MTKLHAASLVDLAKDEIERRIYSGQLADGERIVIDKLSRELGISTVPLREALARLHAQKLVSFEPNRGYAVLPPPTAEEMAGLFDIRLALEVGALELIDFPVPAEKLAPLRSINERIAAGGFAPTEKGYRDFAQLNLRFHKGILELAGNAGLLRTYEDLGYHQLVGRVVNQQGLADLALIADEHEHIIGSLASGSRAKAQKILSNHVAGGKKRFVNSFDQPSSPATTSPTAPQRRMSSKPQARRPRSHGKV